MSNRPFHPEYLTRSINFCFHADCPLGKTCLRRIAFEVSPSFIASSFLDPRLPMGKACEHYLSDELIRYARGFSRGASLLSRRDLPCFRDRIREELHLCRANYYNLYSGRKAISPIQQATIRAIFAEYGVEGEDPFDSYEEGYLLD